MTSISETITKRLQEKNVRFFANDNISAHISKDEKDALIDELAIKFTDVLKGLIIDVENDPNSQDTGRRLAKMYIKEIMSGRYEAPPKVTAFPNSGTEAYHGMLVVRAELKSMCSHHHQPVTGTAYIGIIPTDKVLGLSKYVRIAQWTARRGTLQEQLCNEIAKNIMDHTESENVAVYIAATHGCCENRGVNAHSSLTQTTVVHGLFHNNSVKQEFMDNIKMQELR